MARVQADDPAYPAYLEVGTEVSAKYRGAFCEAKVRKVVKQVKAKVSMRRLRCAGRNRATGVAGGRMGFEWEIGLVDAIIWSIFVGFIVRVGCN